MLTMLVRVIVSYFHGQYIKVYIVKCVVKCVVLVFNRSLFDTFTQVEMAEEYECLRFSYNLFLTQSQYMRSRRSVFWCRRNWIYIRLQDAPLLNNCLSRNSSLQSPPREVLYRMTVNTRIKGYFPKPCTRFSSLEGRRSISNLSNE